MELAHTDGADSVHDQQPKPIDVSTEIARAELFIAADGSYVETTSAHAARELKRKYDALLGVGKGQFLRSPYAITAVMVHGRTMFRISRRVDDADVLPDTARVSRRATLAVTSPSATNMATTKHRKSRLSVSAFLGGRDRDRVSHDQHLPPAEDTGPRKLRKVRSGGELAVNPYSYYSSTPSESELTNGRTVDRGGVYPYLHVPATSTDPFADVVGLSGGTRAPGRLRGDSAASGNSLGAIGVPSYFDGSASFVASSVYGETPSTGYGDEIAPFGPGVRYFAPAAPPGATRDRIGLGTRLSGRSRRSGHDLSSDDDEDLDEDLRPQRTRKKSKPKGKPKSHSRTRGSDDISGRGRPMGLREMASFESGRTARRASVSPSPPMARAPSPTGGRRRASTMPSLDVSTWATASAASSSWMGDTMAASEDGASTSESTLFPSQASVPAIEDLGSPARTPSASSSDAEDSDSSTESLMPLPLSLSIPANSSSIIFDVLQTYSGLPRPSRLSAKSALETVRISAAQGPGPKDDPRFVLYGTLSTSRGPYTVGPASAPTETTGDSEPNKLMLAATIERWVASLTSTPDYDALLDFFLTYRSYVTASSLLSILKERFAWTMDQPTSTERRTVRVRTFLAIRYWMVTFFRVDFLRDEALRRDVASWVNELGRDARVRNATDAMSIVRKLKKLIMECKSLYAVASITSPGASLSSNQRAMPTPSMIASPPRPSSPSALRGNPFDEPSSRPGESSEAGTSTGTGTLGDLSNAASFAASIQKAAEMSLSMSRVVRETADVDLELGPLDSLDWSPAHIGGFAAPDGFGAAFAAAERAARTRGASVSGPIASGMASSAAALTGGGMQSAPQAAMSHLLLSGALLAPASSAGGSAGAAVSPPVPGGMERRSSGVSRALVNTLGKLGRWKRAFSTGPPTNSGVYSPGNIAGTSGNPGSGMTSTTGLVSGGLEARSPPRVGEHQRQPHAHVQSYGREREVLTVKGGVQEYLRLLGGEPAPVSEGSTKEEHREEVVAGHEPARTSDIFEPGEIAAREQDVGHTHSDPDITARQTSVLDDASTYEDSIADFGRSSGEFDRRMPRDSFASESSYGSVLPSNLAKARQIFVGEPLATHQEDTLDNEPQQVAAGDDDGSFALPPGLGGVQFNNPYPFTTNSLEASTSATREVEQDPMHLARPVTPTRTTEGLEGPKTPSASFSNRAQPTYFRHSIASTIQTIASESSYGDEFVSRTLLPPGLVFSGFDSDFASNSASAYGSQPSYAVSASGLPELVGDDGAEASDQASLVSFEDQHAPEVGVVRLDELSDSDAESDGETSGIRAHHPAARRLPRRRDFDLVRHSASVSSMHTRSSRAASQASIGGNERDVVIGGPVQQWQIDMINELVSDDGEDTGDAEFALRKLEGRIDADRQREKLRKVDGWLAAIQKRMVDGPPDSDGDEEEDAPVLHRRSGEDEQDEAEADEVRRAGQMLEVEAAQDESMFGATTPTSIPVDPSPIIPASEVPIVDSSLSAHADLPPTATTPITPTPMHPQQDTSSRRPSISRPVPNTSPASVHQSFVLLHRSEAVAQHLASVDRELFIAVRFDEIVSHDWERFGQGLDGPDDTEEQVNPTDWAAFLRARRALGRKASDVLAVKARFNLVASWVASEIALSHAGQRAAVAGKFIRIAWKSYLLNNYAAVVGIMAGLQSQWAQRAMGKTWTKVGTWEMRLFDDLRAFTSREGNFRFVREATREASVDGKNCVPFIGIYLAQLHDLSNLPDFVDPTSPGSIVSLVSPTPTTRTLSSPRAPEVFANLPPLPQSVALEPLVNIHKQRRIAGVIKALVAGQHLADAARPVVPDAEPAKASADRRLLQRCVRLKALDERGFNRALGLS